MLPPVSARRDEVSLRKPFGWTARFDEIVRRMRISELPRIATTNRPAAIAIVGVFVLATALLLVAANWSPAHKDVNRAPATAASEPAAQSQSAAGAATPPVTITGCLERDDETFRLKDTDGAEAPKSRSWKTGFLKKRSASIAIVDAANRLKLTNYVGQRVSVTGTLIDREMRARALQRVATSCSAKL
jgi:hypothetical protein